MKKVGWVLSVIGFVILLGVVGADDFAMKTGGGMMTMSVLIFRCVAAFTLFFVGFLLRRAAHE